MSNITTGKHQLNYEVVDLTAGWVDKPETIIFHHGVGASLKCWYGWAAALQDRFRLIMFDLPGHGNSVPGDDEISIDDMVGDLLKLADHLNCRKFHLVGESIGGTVSLKTAADYPDRLLSLTISNGAHIGGSITNVDFWHSVIKGEGMTKWSERMMPARFFDGALTADARDWYFAQQANADPETVLSLLEALVGTDLTDRLSKITAPTLIMHPDSSPFISLQLVANLYQQMNDAQIRTFPKTRHGLPFSHAIECSTTFRGFLDALSGRPI